MSLNESLQSLKDLIYRVDNVGEQKRLIGKIIKEYGDESTAFSQLKEEHSILKAEHAQLKAETAERIPALEAENASLKIPPTEEVRVHKFGVRFVKTKETHGQFIPRCPKCEKGAVKEVPQGQYAHWVCALCDWWMTVETDDCMASARKELGI